MSRGNRARTALTAVAFALAFSMLGSGVAAAAPLKLAPVEQVAWQSDAAGEVTISWLPPAQDVAAQRVHLSLTSVSANGTAERVIPVPDPQATQLTIASDVLHDLGAPVGSGIRFRFRIEALGTEGFKSSWSPNHTAVAGQGRHLAASATAKLKLSAYNIALTPELSDASVTRIRNATAQQLVESQTAVVALQESVKLTAHGDTQLAAFAKRVNAEQKKKLSSASKKKLEKKRKKLEKAAKKSVKKAVKKATIQAKKSCAKPTKKANGKKVSPKRSAVKKCVAKAKTKATKQAKKKASAKLKRQTAYTPWKLVRTERYVGRYETIGGEGTRIIYDSRKVKLLSQCTGADGVERLGAKCTIKLPRAGGVLEQRWGQYAQFQDKKTRKKFWVVSVHFAHRQGEAHGNIRDSQLKAVEKRMRKLSGETTQPIFIMGDYNMSAGAPEVAESLGWLAKRGYVDAATAPKSVNLEYPTYNRWGTRVPGTSGFGNRIDKIYGSGKRLYFSRYETVVDGGPASDHYLIRATAHF